MAVLLRVETNPVAVLEIDAEVLDRLAPELVLHARVDRFGERGREVDGAREILRRGRVLLERAQCQGSQALRGVGVEQMSAPVDGMHRLALALHGQRRTTIRAVRSSPAVRRRAK